MLFELVPTNLRLVSFVLALDAKYHTLETLNLDKHLAKLLLMYAPEDNLAALGVDLKVMHPMLHLDLSDTQNLTQVGTEEETIVDRGGYIQLLI